MKFTTLSVIAIIFSMLVAGIAEAKGKSSSFRSGFSSQKKTSYRAPEPQKTAPAPKASFGSFGSGSDKSLQKNTAMPQSNMSKDLQGSAAQANALKTADARTQSQSKPDAPSESGWFRSGNQNKTQASGTASGAGYQQTQRAPRQYERNQGGNGLMYGLMGFMLGSSMGSHANPTVVNNHQNSGVDTSNQTDAAQPVQAAPVEEESFFMTLLRWALWGLIIWSLIWVVRKVMAFRNKSNRPSARYNLGG